MQLSVMTSFGVQATFKWAAYKLTVKTKIGIIEKILLFGEIQDCQGIKCGQTMTFMQI